MKTKILINILIILCLTSIPVISEPKEFPTLKELAVHLSTNNSLRDISTYYSSWDYVGPNDEEDKGDQDVILFRKKTTIKVNGHDIPTQIFLFYSTKTNKIRTVSLDLEESFNKTNLLESDIINELGSPDDTFYLWPGGCADTGLPYDIQCKEPKGRTQEDFRVWQYKKGWEVMFNAYPYIGIVTLFPNPAEMQSYPQCPPLRIISGKAIRNDDSHSPIPDIYINLWIMDDVNNSKTKGQWLLVDTATTDARGNYIFSAPRCRIYRGQYKIDASCIGANGEDCKCVPQEKSWIIDLKDQDISDFNIICK